jgi:hypothetical protein
LDETKKWFQKKLLFGYYIVLSAVTVKIFISHHALSCINPGLYFCVYVSGFCVGVCVFGGG